MPSLFADSAIGTLLSWLFAPKSSYQHDDTIDLIAQDRGDADVRFYRGTLREPLDTRIVQLEFDLEHERRKRRSAESKLQQIHGLTRLVVFNLESEDSKRITALPRYRNSRLLGSTRVGAREISHGNDQFVDARDWSMPRRVFIAGVICLYTFVVYTASAIYVIGVHDVMADFSIGEQEALLGLSVYVLAYGLGPLLWAPLSELNFIGRNPIYALTFIAFVGFSVLSATIRDWPGYLVVRFFQAFFGSPCLAIGGASMHDLFSENSVPYSLAVWIAAAYCGPALGPLIAGYLVPKKGWRWGMWEIVWLAGPTCILILLLPETHGPTRRARRMEVTGSPEQKGQASHQTWSRFKTILWTLGDAIVKPIQICIQDPAVAVANLYTSFIYATYYTLFDAIPRVYVLKYGFSPGELGLSFLSVIVACTIGGIIYRTYISKVLNPQIQQGRSKDHELHLRPALLATFLLPIGLALFGWTSNGTIHWMVSLIGVTLYAMGTFIVLQCLSVYLPRIYPDYSASLFAANDFCRSSLAAAAVHVGIPLYENLGIGKGVSVLAGLSVLGIAGIWFIYWKGAALRARSRFVVI